MKKEKYFLTFSFIFSAFKIFSPSLNLIQETNMTRQQNPSKALLLSLIPGLGQIYNKQKAKGFIFLGVTLAFLIYFFAIASGELGNLITLGEMRGRDNSLFMLIRGAFHLIIVLVYFLFYAFNLKDAHTTAKRWNNGIPVHTTL